MLSDISLPYSEQEPHEAQDSSPPAKEYGFWLYLMSDAVIFALLFSTYATMSHNYAGGPTGSELFELNKAFYETLLLLLSTTTCGFAMLHVAAGDKLSAQIWFVITFLLGFGFVSMEINEFYGLIRQEAGPQRSGFLSAFFTLVGTHGLHVCIGLTWLLVMLVQTEVKGLTQPVRSRLYRFSLFWHFLDLVWVLIFTVVYLMGVLS
ncbi:cytochrome o ubiquinol oxidase subunit III [Methylomarinum vadi]|uniref:cytochrome o ubiquinol oxidase subunit III n=1 Tax=Methylomarinum vadi TaxID=438855 RepID=UPI0004DF88F7|nr:cytochrome o ubiquinol oxidase subunit III [Methylomarinum vadi]